jgi:hypothetical protein
MALRLEPVDTLHPNLIALVRGPQVLFAVADSQPEFGRFTLLQARPSGNPSGDWIAESTGGSPVVFRPFTSIRDESYSTYVAIKS